MHLLPPAFLLHAAASKLGPGRWREARRGTATCSVDPGCRCRDGLGSTWRRRACPGQRFRALPAILGGAASALCGPPWCRCRTAGTRPCAATRLGARGEAATRGAAEIRMPCQRRQTGTACAAPQFVGRLYWQVGLPGNFLYSKQSELVNLTTPLTLCLNLN